MKPIEPDTGTASDLHAHACPWRIAKWLAVSTLVLVVLPGLLTWGVYSLGMWFRGLDLDGLQTLLWWAYVLTAVGLGALGWVLALGYWCIVVADCTQFMGLDGPAKTGATFACIHWPPMSMTSGLCCDSGCP